MSLKRLTKSLRPPSTVQSDFWDRYAESVSRNGIGTTDATTRHRLKRVPGVTRAQALENEREFVRNPLADRQIFRCHGGHGHRYANRRSAIFDGDASRIMFSRCPQGIDQRAEVLFIDTPAIDRIRKEFLPNLNVACRMNRTLGSVKFKTLGMPFETQG